MPDTWIALVAVFSVQIGAIALGLIAGHQRKLENAAAAKERRAEKLEDWARADAVKAAVEDAAEKAAGAAALLADRDQRQEDEAEAARVKAEEAAGLLLKAQQESIRRTNEVARVAAESQATALGEIHEIKVLANSTLTAAMNGELGAMQRELVLMKDVRALHEAAGHPASADALSAIEATEAKIEEMRVAVADRVEQTVAAEKATRVAQEGGQAP
jgi:hypothetical protein